jgi:hypothetical protein
MKIVGLISTYQEEELLPSVIDSAKDLDMILVFRGPVGADADSWKEVWDDSNVTLQFEGEWVSDASKRTSMLDIARVLTDGKKDVWGLWLDGDEILLWGEYLKDHCRRADMQTATGGTALKIVEYDGSVAECYGKLIKLTAIKQYIMSSYEVELTNGLTVALPNVPICYPGGIPYGNIKNVNDPLLAINRPPLQGEPHLLHRHGLRNPERTAERLHDTEAESFQTLVKDAGLEGVDKTAGSTAMLTDPLEEEDM